MTSAKKVFRAWAIVNVLLAGLASSDAIAAVPAKPTNLAATSVSSSQIKLTWQQKPTNNVESFTIRVATNSAFTDAWNMPVSGGKTTTYTHEGLQPATTYWYKIRAIGSGSNVWSAWTTAVSATTYASISSRFFGLNAWMPWKIGTATKNGKLEEKLCGLSYDASQPPFTQICIPSEIHASSPKIMRYGGSTVNKNYIDNADLSLDQYLVMVKNMRTNGIEPILQVPYYRNGQTPTDAIAQAIDRATALVNYINFDQVAESGGVKYWTIGNEPDKDGLTAPDIAEYFKAIAQAMKAADSSILIIGPDLSSYQSSIMGPLTNCLSADPADQEVDITGDFIGADGKHYSYVDIISFHSYPFDGSQSRTEVTNQGSNFEETLSGLKSTLAECNTAHKRTGRPEDPTYLAPLPLKMAVTEINVDWRNPGDIDKDTGAPVGGPTAENNLAGVGASSFLAGHFWAEMMSIGMNQGLEFITFWSVMEGDDLGYIKHDDTILPTYYHFQMLAKNFRGMYASGTTLGNPPDDPNMVKAFGSKDGSQIAVMILNHNETTSFSYTVRLNKGPVSGTKDLKINIDAGVNQEYSNLVNELLSPQSTVLLIFNANGVFQSRTVYSLNDHALLNLPPS